MAEQNILDTSTTDKHITPPSSEDAHEALWKAFDILTFMGDVLGSDSLDTGLHLSQSGRDGLLHLCRQCQGAVLDVLNLPQARKA